MFEPGDTVKIKKGERYSLHYKGGIVCFVFSGLSAVYVITRIKKVNILELSSFKKQHLLEHNILLTEKDLFINIL